jgi:hypothetical protein
MAIKLVCFSGVGIDVDRPRCVYSCRLEAEAKPANAGKERTSFHFLSSLREINNYRLKRPTECCWTMPLKPLVMLPPACAL